MRVNFAEFFRQPLTLAFKEFSESQGTKHEEVAKIIEKHKREFERESKEIIELYEVLQKYGAILTQILTALPKDNVPEFQKRIEDARDLVTDMERRTLSLLKSEEKRLK